ncbi:hypothetical protein [Frigoribacterium sp. VKM Ac-2836]|nr:hypothetical protein [Frigoribacterium sp. VKM Ac-2836]
MSFFIEVPFSARETVLAGTRLPLNLLPARTDAHMCKHLIFASHLV